MKARFVRAAAVIATLAVAGGIATGCGSDTGGSDTVGKGLAKEQILRTMVNSEPATLDPARMQDADSFNVINQMFASLYRIEGQESELVPYLASELPEISEDGLTYTIKLRDDANWSNGQKITADDVVYGVQRSLDPKVAGYYATLLYPIVGACEWNSSAKDEGEKPGDDAAKCGGKLETDGKADSVAVKAMDPQTLEIKLKQATPWFDSSLALSVFSPQPKATIEKNGDSWTLPANIVTSGPFTLKKKDGKKSYVLAKSDSFWDKDKITLDQVVIEFISEAATGIRRFERGKLDTGFTRSIVPPAQIEKWKADERYVSVDTISTNYAYVNTANAKLKDPKVRQGIAQAINRKAIVENITKRGDTPVNTVVPTTIPGFDTIKGGADNFLDPKGEPDTELAGDLLKEGGWKDGDTITVYFPTDSPTAENIATAMQSDLKKVNVEAKLIPVGSFDDFLTLVSPMDPKVDIALLSWVADYPDAQSFYQLFTCGNIENGLNSPRFCDEDYDKLYGEAIETLDTDARTAAYKELEAKLTGPDGGFPVVPLYQPKDDTVVQKWVDNLEYTPLGLFFLDDVKIREH